MIENKLWRSHNLEQVKDENGITTSGSLIVWEDTPVSPLSIGDDFQPVPNGPVLKVGKINVSDSVIGERFGRPYRQWQITIEGDTNTQAVDDDDTNIQYDFVIEKDDDGVMKYTGSMAAINTGETPSLNIKIGDKFTVPGIGDINCVKISGGDEYTDSGLHRWRIVYDGTKVIPKDGGNDAGDPNTQYDFVIEKDDNGDIKYTGSMGVLNTGATPSLDINIGDKFTIPTIGEVTCIKISGGDEYTDNNTHRWRVTYEAEKVTANEDSDIEDNDINIRYDFVIEKTSEGITRYAGTMEVVNTGDTPSLEFEIGDVFNIPCIGEVVCTKINGSDDYTDNGIHRWKMIYDGAKVTGDNEESTSIPDDEESVTYELNGITTRSVSGEFIALRRSANPIIKKSITRYTANSTQIVTIGAAYSGGVAISEQITKENLKIDGVQVGTYYRHDIEVET